jgi:molybdopterin/thiamine biosynthesis adenylyltransferase
LPEVGEAGQQKLLNATVLLIGIGGLGSPSAMYLVLPMIEMYLVLPMITNVFYSPHDVANKLLIANKLI